MSEPALGSTAPTDPLPTRASLWVAGHAPEGVAHLLARVHPRVLALEDAGDYWRLELADETVALSDPRQITRFVGPGMHGRVRSKYELPYFMRVNSGDTVVDVGAFIGEFARSVALLSDRLVAVEPDPRNAAALRRNLRKRRGSDRASVVEAAAWGENGPTSINLASDPSETSLLALDHGQEYDHTFVLARRLDDILAEHSIDHVDFLKVEAEGAEPEVLDGLGDVRPWKIAVECSPERDGSSPAPEIHGTLLDWGYDVRYDRGVVFGLGGDA